MTMGPTVSGRFSSREPNPGNIPKHTKEVREVKAAFLDGAKTPDTDYTWVEERVANHMEGKE